MERKNFTSVELNHGTLMLPSHVADKAKNQFLAPHELTPANQELKGQYEVFGTDGHGSIRNDSSDLNSTQDQFENAEKQLSDSKQEKARIREEARQKLVAEMLDPANILDLKAKYDHKVARQKDESSISIDKTLDKDGSVAAKNSETASSTKDLFIADYTQTGIKEGKKRRFKKDTLNRISEMMSMSYADLEKMAESENGNNNFESASDTSVNSQVNPFDSLPDINTRKAPEQAELSEKMQKLIDAINDGDEEDFDRFSNYFRHEVLASDIINGQKYIDAFEIKTEADRQEMLNNKNRINETPEDINDVPPIVVYDEDLDFGDIIDEDVNEEAEYLPPVIIINDQDVLEVAPAKEKKSKRNKVLAGLLVGALAIGSFFALKSASDDNSSVKEGAPVESVEDAPVITVNEDTLDALAKFDDATDTENQTAGEAPEDTAAEETADVSDAEQQALKVALYGETGAIIEGKIDTTFLSGLDASKIRVGGDVMPYTNAVEAGAENPIATSNAMLTIFNQAYPENQFELREDGKYWSTTENENRQMNPEELAQYNELMQFIVANN